MDPDVLSEYASIMTWIHIVIKWKQYDHMMICMRYYYNDYLNRLFKMRNFNEDFISNIAYIDTAIDKLRFEKDKAINDIEFL
jgi:hypothetical protein